MKIVVMGIGGVGGYFGGLLAKKYESSADAEIIFVARGEHLKKIQEYGLKVVHCGNDFIARPSLATDNANEIGTADLVILATKSYDLESAVEQVKPCIGPHTLLLPLQNGVDATDRVKAMLPAPTVLVGCVYIVAKVKEPGVVDNSGNVQSLFFGIDNTTNDRLLQLEKIFKDAGIEATLSPGISTILWEKFIFISPTATANSYFDIPIGQMMAEHPDDVRRLVEEVTQVAVAMGVNVGPEATEKTLHRIKSMPHEATSSMYRDFQAHSSRTEVQSLTGYVVEQGKKLGIATPGYERMYEGLMKR